MEDLPGKENAVGRLMGDRASSLGSGESMRDED